MEQNEIDANGQANADNAPNKGCVNTTDPYYEADNPASTRCQKDANGSYTGHIEVYMTDINPNSSTHGTQAWEDGGSNESSCPHTVGEPPSLNVAGYSTNTGSGVVIYDPNTLVTIAVTLFSSDPGARLTGKVGDQNINLSGSGTNKQTVTTTVTGQGYLSWTLTLSGNASNGGYVSSAISFNP